MKFSMILNLALMVSLTTLVNCGKNSSTDVGSVSADTSSSGLVAGAVGGALSDSSSSGTQAFYKKFSAKPTLTAEAQRLFALMPEANASSLCPTFHTTGTGCAASGSTMDLSYSDCTFTGNASWNGEQALTMSSGTAACGSFPNPGANGTLLRQFVTSGGAAGSINLTAGGLSATIDDATADLGNFDGQTISTLGNSGYGTKVTFNSSGARSQLQIDHHLTVSGIFDHSIDGTVTVSESAGASSRTLNGTVKLYHNLLRVVGTSTLTNVVHEDICCLPMSGTISTTYAAGQNVSPHNGGAQLVGKTETLTFTGCGTATFTNTNGVSADVTLSRCY